MKELEKKVENYLKNKNIQYLSNSINYLGFREKARQIEGPPKSMHVVTFFLDTVTDSDYADDGLCSVWIDSESERLDFLVTPHTIETIYEE